MSLILKALDFARAKHEGQVRKVSNEPYINHPMEVSYIVASYKKSKHMEELLAASYLHDTLEDTNTNFVELATEFGGMVAGLVLELTNDEAAIAKIGKLEYQKKKLVGISSYALVVKLADRLHNISDHPTEKMVLQTVELMQYLKANRKLSKTHKAMVEEVFNRCAQCTFEKE